MLIPVSTDVHDGKIRMGALAIIMACVVVHVMVATDAKQTGERMAQVKNRFEQPATWQPLLDSSAAHAHDTASLDTSSLEEQMSAVKRQIQRSFQDTAHAMWEGTLMYKLGLKPAMLSPVNLLTYMFVHGGWMHLIGNLLFFYVCGIAMEKYWGFWRFICAYLGCGVFAGLFYLGSTMVAPLEIRAGPLVGASGAIAGIMGAMVVTHANVRVRVLYAIPRLGLSLVKFGTFGVPTYIYFGFWFAAQIASTVLEPSSGAGIAYAAHIGGFGLGALLGWLLKSEDEDALLVPAQVMRRIAGRQAPRAVVPEGMQEHVTAGSADARQGSAAWQAYKAGDLAQAGSLLTRVVDNLMQSGDQRRGELSETLGRVLSAVPPVPIPPAHLYQWGKNAGHFGLVQQAAACFDRAAAAADSPHLLKNALMGGAALRLRAGFEFEKARADLQRVITLDQGGLFGKEAQRLLSGQGGA